MFGLWEGIDGARIMAVPHAQDYVSRFDGQELSNNGKLVDLAKTVLIIPSTIIMEPETVEVRLQLLP